MVVVVIVLAMVLLILKEVVILILGMTRPKLVAMTIQLVIKVVVTMMMS